MKIIALFCIIALASAASNNQTIAETTLSTATAGNWTFSLSTTTLTDGVGTYSAIFKVTPAALDASAADLHEVLCIDTQTSGHSLSADKTGLTAFGLTATEASTATFVAGSTALNVGTAANYTHSTTTFNHGAMPAVTSPAGTDSLSATAAQVTYSSLSEANRVTIGLPMSNGTAYYACWQQLNLASAVAFTSAADVSSSWVGRQNITIGAYGAAVVAGFAATLAYAF